MFWLLCMCNLILFKKKNKWTVTSMNDEGRDESCNWHEMTVTLQLGYTPVNIKIITKVVCLDEIPHLTETLIMKSCLLLYFIFKLHIHCEKKIIQTRCMCWKNKKPSSQLGKMSTGKYSGLVFETIINASRDQLLTSLHIFKKLTKR